jgi:hypothetical protein
MTAVQAESPYVVKRCGVDDISAVMEFFGENHDPLHIFASNRQFVDWQYYVPESHDYNILIAKDDNSILGLFAYIPNTFFDSDIPPEHKFVWTANWLVKKDYKGFVGLDLFYSLPKYERCKNLGIIGLTDGAAKFYQKLGYRVGKLKHYFFVNENIDRFKILGGYKRLCADAQRTSGGYGGRIERIDSFIGLESLPVFEYLISAEPCKSAAFFENKYLRSPFYNYIIYALKNESGIAAALVCRVVSHNCAKVVRAVEYIGRAEYLAEARLQYILDEHNAEYIDLYCEGIPHDMLGKAGFMLNTGQHGLIVPNYFEPFKNANIEIAYAYKFAQPNGQCYIFKGDGDRDHPR